MAVSAPGGLSLPAEWDVPGLLARSQRATDVVVAVAVHNGGAAVARCLDSVRRHTRSARVVVIDDASTDPDIVRDLDLRAERGEIELVRHRENLGYTRSANEALQLSDTADVILLNSDTEVGPGWVRGMRTAALSHPATATVSALSDNAGAMAMPVAGEANRWPAHLSWTEIARAVTQAELPLTVPTPTGHGFCMLITREAIRLLGGFDEVAYPRGYGEENDFCMRAAEHGLVNLLAPRVFVQHERGQSFGPAREKLMKAGRAAVDARHPSYTAEIRAWAAGSAMRDLRVRFATLLESLGTRTQVPPRRLYVLHRAGGGTPATNLDLMTALAEHQDSWLLESDTRTLFLSHVQGTQLREFGTWEADTPFTATDTWRQDYAEVVAQLVVDLGIDLIHVRHLINHPLATLPEVASRLDFPFILSTHDFYMACPTVHLLDENDVHCGGICTPGPGSCRLPTTFVAQVPPLKHAWIHEWHARTEKVLASADAVVATTNSAKEILGRSLPGQADRIRVIEHGRDLEDTFRPLRTDGARHPGPPRILAVAHWDPHKGLHYLETVARILGPKVEFHVIGKRSELLSEVATVHGVLERDAMRRVITEIDPDFAALFSISPETYSHTLSEAWALGIPVLATDIGALGERVRTHGGGILLPVDDPRAAAALIGEIIADPETAVEWRSAIPRPAARTRAAMAQSYRSLYDEVTDHSNPPRVGYLVPGTSRNHPGSTHIRLLGRLRALEAGGGARVRQVFDQDLDRDLDLRALADLDVLIVQRDVLGIHTDLALAAVQLAGVRLVVDIDDYLFSDDAAWRCGRTPTEHQNSCTELRRLLAAADEVIVSTRPLQEALNESARREPILIPNRLEPRLWLGDVPATRKPRGEAIRLLYMGTRTHVEDLLLLEGVPEAVAEATGRRVILEIVGIAAASDVPPWAVPLGVPPGASNYPKFVQWLRSRRQRWDAAVAPLVDSQFNSFKSDLKLLEYALLDLPVVASDVGPYQGAEHLAMLTPNTPEDWTQALVATLSGAGKPGAAAARSNVLAERMLNGADLTEWISAILGTRSVRGPGLAQSWAGAPQNVS